MISVKDISYSYGDRSVLNKISFDAKAGECVAILGNNGAGKSTLISCINRILRASAGEVYVDGKDFFALSRNERARAMSYVAQKNEVSHMTVMDAVLLGRKPYIGWALQSEDIEKCHAVIEHMGLSDFRARNIDELSGGELQKVMLARALAQEPKVLLLDEPTSNLDPKNQHDVLSFVQEIAREHQISVLVVLHDISHALRYCDKFLLLHEAEVYDYGDESVISEKAMLDVYGVQSSIIEFGGRKLVVVD